MRPVFSIHGGVHPPENKAQSTAEPIAVIPLAKHFILPLNQHIGAAAQAIVTLGQKVLKGEVLAEAQGLVSAPVHAPTSGEIIAIEERPVPHPSGLSALSIVLQADGKDQWTELSPIEDYHAHAPQHLLEIVRNAGIAGMGGAGFPTAVKLNPRSDQHVSTLILNGTECEPYITADDVLMRERAEEIVAGAELLAYLLKQPKDILIGVEDNKPQAIEALQKAAQNSSVEIVSFPTKYPSGGEKQLIEILTGKQVPSGAIPATIGIVVQNVGTVLAAWRAVRYGEPLLSRITTIVGDSLAKQRNIDVPLGTPIEHILKEHGWQQERCARIVIGGPMMGFAIDHADVPVIKTTNCVLVPSTEEMPAQPPAQACIRCGMCAEACPASLLPQQLLWYSQSENHEQLRSHNLFDCIECGACSYVCPSNIPLVQYYRASKGEIRKQDQEKEKSDRSRLRFESRKTRIEKAEAEKEAKRLARKKAAEEAKKIQAEKAKLKQSDSGESNIVSAAIAAASEKAVDPEKEKAKLERAFSSAESRVSRAKEQLQKAQDEGADDSRIESLKARLKQAEQKLNEAQNKLAEFANRAPATSERVLQKLAASPQEKVEKAIASVEKRLASAEEKLAEARENNSPTLAALEQGVAKLKEKLEQNRSELAQVKAESGTSTPSQTATQTEDLTLNAAQQAIEKAKAKAAAQANLSAEEKQAQQLESLLSRLEKAKQRLQKAEAENNENVDAFRMGVDKLQAKLDQAQAAQKENSEVGS
ncbi:electron transport complex protein RnfC [Alteromonadaceae bacterium Bs31]|nr:electron transport complex protein RnfC [Alteromonadaceae bacterium Bs31]